jgi:hypothetical protein
MLPVTNFFGQKVIYLIVGDNPANGNIYGDL